MWLLMPQLASPDSTVAFRA